ncbi:polyamine-modulated factor 1 [Triplophysa rosa]|uniref:Polyamine-modulated factor 1 n=1 Tax=Triplophysa rosa TaxID=992332 RepID=A0A9W7TRV3_TRIRA|nr:polyamine-modulated factor 1 [Triplophysa rosa]KAI7801263.1 putative polyamine-modulated factor 1 [Triplophysa rosa]
MEETEKKTESHSVENNVDEVGIHVNVSSEASARRNDAVKSSQSKPRLKLFQKVMEKSLQWLVNSAGFDRFSHYLQPLSKQNPQLTEAMHKQFISQLQTLVQNEIGSVIEEGDLKVKLEELDKLEELAKGISEPAWRPSGVPEQDVCSDLVSYYKKQEEYMRLQLKKLQKKTAALAQKVQAGRESITDTEQRIASAVEEWKTSLQDLEAFVLTRSPPESF